MRTSSSLASASGNRAMRFADLLPVFNHNEEGKNQQKYDYFEFNEKLDDS